MEKRKKRSLWYVVAIDALVLALAVLLMLGQPAGSAVYYGLRLAALTGFGLIYLSVLSSLFMRELVRALGQPFVQVHHVLSVVALTLVTLHPLGLAWYNLSAKVLLPDLSSWSAVYAKSGPFIWLTLSFGLASALLRKKVKWWRIVHWVNYAAFLLAVTHAWRLGSDMQSLGMRVVIVLMAASVVGAFVWKRIKMAKKPVKKAAAA